MSFSVNENYEYFYKKNLQGQECYEFGMITAAFIVEGQIFSNAKRG